NGPWRSRCCFKNSTHCAMVAWGVVVGIRVSARMSSGPLPTMQTTLVPPVSTPPYKAMRVHFLFDPQPILDLFQRNSLGFRQEHPHQHELQQHHYGKEGESAGAGGFGDYRETPTHDRSPKPVGKAAQRLAAGANAIGKNLAEINPDHRALRESKECDVA